MSLNVAGNALRTSHLDVLLSSCSSPPKGSLATLIAGNNKVDLVPSAMNVHTQLREVQVERMSVLLSLEMSE